MSQKKKKIGKVWINVKLKHIRKTTVDVEKKYVWNILSVCVSVAFTIQHAKHIRYIVISSLSRSTPFFHIISQPAQFLEKSYWKQNVFLFFLQLLSEKCHSVRYTKCILAFMLSTC